MTKKKEGKFEVHTFLVKERGRKGWVKRKNDGSGTKNRGKSFGGSTANRWKIRDWKKNAKKVKKFQKKC